MLIKNTSFTKHAKKYHSRYINYFIGLKSAIDMLRLNLFPNAKEITESMGGFNSIKHFPIRRDDPNINIVVVGDGHKPRTAALCAFMSKWNCVSIDPELRRTEYPIKRLTCYKSKIEDLKLEFDSPTVLLLVHSHAPSLPCIENIKAPIKYISSIPCCFPDNFGIPDTTYIDENIWSPKNRVNTYVHLS